MIYYCEKCGIKVAIIDDGKLKIGVVFLCKKCYDNLVSGNMFNDIFGRLK